MELKVEKGTSKMKVVDSKALPIVEVSKRMTLTLYSIWNSSWNKITPMSLA